jgi:transposase
VEHIGIDVHKKDSQVCILPESGDPIEIRFATRADRFGEALGGRPRARVLLEASTESEWVARTLEALGHEVIVADPNFAPMYGTRTRRVKTDRRDARSLAEACRAGTFRVAHRRSDAQRQVNARLAVRDALVRTRSRFIALARALLRGRGYRVPSGEAETFAARVAAMNLPGELLSAVAPLLARFDLLNSQIAFSDEAIAVATEDDEVVQNLQTVPGIGPVTAAAFRALVDDARRFRGPHQVEAYIGLVPSEKSSGEKQRKGRITKTGNGRMRWLLVQAAHGIRRSKSLDSLRLREWAQRIELRRGRGVALVALARKLAGILFAMMRDESRFNAQLTANTRPPMLAA